MCLAFSVFSKFRPSTPSALIDQQSINDLVLPGGRLHEDRDIAHKLLSEIPGVSCVKPQGALYLFPRVDPDAPPRPTRGRDVWVGARRFTMPWPSV